VEMLPVRWVDARSIDTNPTSGLPRDIWRRTSVGERWVVAGLDPDGSAKWFAVTGDGDYVSVPLVPYNVMTSPEQVLGFGIELAVRLMLTLPVFMQAHGLRSVNKLQLSLASPSQDLSPDQPAYRVFAGVAFQVS